MKIKDPRKLLILLIRIPLIIIFILMLFRDFKKFNFTYIIVTIILLGIALYFIIKYNKNKDEEWKYHNAIGAGYVVGFCFIFVPILAFVLAFLADRFISELLLYGLYILLFYGIFLIYYSLKCRRFEKKQGLR